MIGKLILLLVTSCIFAQAEVPKTRPLSDYYHLWQQSPFTVKPVLEQTETAVVNDLDDYVLLGVEVTPNGNLVVVQNVKEDGQRTTISTWDGGTSGFKILEVKQDPKSTLATRVLLEKGSYKGWVGYDPQYLALKSAPAPAAAKKDNTQNRGDQHGDRRGYSRDGKRSTDNKEPAKARVQYVKPKQ